MLFIYLLYSGGFPGGSGVENLPAIQNMGVQSLDQEDSLKKEIATHLPFLLGKSHGFIFYSIFHYYTSDFMQIKKIKLI